MLADATTADRSAFAQTFDVCVIGAGPAGITLARRLAAAGPHRRADGSRRPRDHRGEPGRLPRHQHRHGVLRPRHLPPALLRRHLEPLGRLDPRPRGRRLQGQRGWVPLSGWPIEQIDLDPYRAEADAILDVPNATEAPNLPVRQTAYDFERFQFRFSPPTRFAEKYLRRDRGLAGNLLLASTPTSSTSASTTAGAAVTGAVFRTYDPAAEPFTVKARAYALCTGGIENARLLLNFTAPGSRGHRQRLRLGRPLLRRPPALHPRRVRSPRPRPRARVLPADRALHGGARLPQLRHPPRAALDLAERAPGDRPRGHAARGVQHPPRKARPRPLRRPHPDRPPRPAPAAGPDRRPPHRLRGGAEPRQPRHPRPTRRDAFGLRRVALDWRLSAQDVQTMRTAVVAFGAHMAEQDIGRLQMAPWLEADAPKFPGIADDEVGGKHHLGTTRMSADARDRRRRRQLPAPRGHEPLHRRLERLRLDRPLQPDLHDRAARPPPRRPPRRTTARLTRGARRAI